MLKILILVNIVISLLGVGVVFYSHNMIKPEVTNQDLEKDSLKQSIIEGASVTPVPIKKFAVNLHSSANRLRFISIEMSALPFYEDQKPLITKHEHMIKDIVIDIAGKLEASDIETVTGKLLFESRIKKQVNAKLGQPVIKQIFFSGFVIQ